MVEVEPFEYGSALFDVGSKKQPKLLIPDGSEAVEEVDEAELVVDELV